MYLAEASFTGYIFANFKSEYSNIFSKTRPNLAEINLSKEKGWDLDSNLYKVNKIYALKDIANENIVYREYLSKLYPDKEVIKVLYLEKRYNCSYGGQFMRAIDSDHIYVIFKEDLELITEYTNKEKKYLEEKKEKESEENIINTLLLDTLNSLAEEYGMENKGGSFRFKSQKDLNTFLYNALDHTIFEHLRQNGFTIYKKGYRGKMGLSTILFTIKDIGIAKNN